MPFEDNPEKQDKRTAMIISHWSPTFKARYGNVFPESYTTFDTETTGFDRRRDVIVEIGHCIVRDCKVVDRLNVVINWLNHPIVPDYFVRNQLTRVRDHMRANGRDYHITPERMAREGLEPQKALSFYLEFFSELQSQGEIFAAHNGWNFDVEMLQAHFEGFLLDPFTFHEDQILDTGAIEKASQMIGDPRTLPTDQDTLKSYFKRVAYMRAPGVKWRLDDHCVTRYDLARRHNLDTTKAHSAGYDAYVLHLLMEEYRQILQQAPEVWPAGLASPAKAPPRKAPLKAAPVKPAGVPAAPKLRVRGQRSR
jgi:DNA polymerase III epsilon subunit-like protein